MKIADTNVILRYILKDHPEFSPRSAELIEQNDIFLPTEIVCEVTYVLQKVYRMNKSDIRTVLQGLSDGGLITVEKPRVLRKALDVYAQKNFDIVDAYLCAYRALEDVEVLTFDEKLQKCLKTEAVIRFERD